MTISRRGFLKHTACIGGVVSFCGQPPRLLSASTLADADDIEHKLIVIYLDGGNDGLNTIIPVHDPLYQRYRRETRIKLTDTIPLNDSVSMHPSMRGLAEIWEQGRLLIVQGVGYPNHSRSHFVSRAVWHAAHPGARPNVSHGWLGQSLDNRQMETESPLAFSLGYLETPVALRGRNTRTAAAPSLSRDEARQVRNLLASAVTETDEMSVHQHVARTQADAISSLGQLIDVDAPDKNDFPKTQLGQQLSQTAWLISSGNPARVFYLKQSGYDTHAAQKFTHAALLRELCDALFAFDKKIAGEGLTSKVSVLVFSEFGRRAAENKSGGTDHGKAGPVLILGGGYKPGLHGTTPSLHDLHEGDLKVTTDFRSIYSTILEHSLNIASSTVLPIEFSPIAELVAK